MNDVKIRYFKKYDNLCSWRDALSRVSTEATSYATSEILQKVSHYYATHCHSTRAATADVARVTGKIV